MDLKHELHRRVTIFESYWKRFFSPHKPVLLYQASAHLPSGGGKRLRPFLTMISCESVGGKTEDALPFAAALELLHNFTLVHDDIMDKSALRRNVETVHVKYGEPTAILAGDLLFAKAFEALHELPVEYDCFKKLHAGLVQAVIDVCEGQQEDMEFEQRSIVTEQEYLSMITKKTAVLFKLAAYGGGLIGGGSAREVQALSDFGVYLGLSFQIWDDYLDMSSDVKTLGKDIGNDIRNGKKTLIAVHALEHADTTQKKRLARIFGFQQASDEDIHEAFALFREIGSVEYAKTTALTYNAKAKSALEKIKPSSTRDILTSVADYSIQRDY
ncbi:MAG: polyprenyl synthetase family protein [Candidatus Thermoplasmatota archaeon]